MTTHMLHRQAGQVASHCLTARRQRALPVCNVYAQQHASDDWRGMPPSGQRSWSNNRPGPSWQPVSTNPAPPVTIRLGGTSITAYEARTALAARMHSYELGVPISAEDQELLLEVLRFHPRAADKQGCGVAHMTVQHTSHGTKCFWIHRTDGTCTDFSCVKCLKNMEYMYKQGLVDENGYPTAPIPDHIPSFRPPRPALHFSPGSPMGQVQGNDSNAWSTRQFSRQQPQVPSWPPLPQDWGQPTSSTTSSSSSSSGSDDDWFASFESEASPTSTSTAASAVPRNSSPRAAPPRPTASQPTWSSTGGAPLGDPQQSPSSSSVPEAQEWSWRDCLLALQAAVAPQLRQYKQAMLSSPAAQRQVLLCAITGETLTPKTSAVRYAPGQTLKDLALGWMQAQGFRHRRQLSVGYVEGHRGPVMLDREQAVSWASYHEQTAVVQLVSKNASRTGAQEQIQQQEQPQ